jgi:HAMP domain-containing protein
MKIFLKEKFLIAFLILILIPLVTVSFFSYSSARKFLMESIKDYNEILVQSIIVGVKDTVLKYKDLSESILYNISLSKTDEDKKEILLENKKNHPYNIKFLSVLDEFGREIVRSDDRELEDRSGKPEFYQIKGNKKEYYIAWLSFNPVVGISTITISVPLFEEDKFQGALISEIFLSNIWSDMVAGYTSPKDNIYLLTQDGQPVAEILASSEDFRSDNLKEIAQELAEKKTVIIQETDTEIGQMLVIADSLPIFEWELVVFRQISEIYKPASILEGNLTLITFIVLIFIFIISIYFSQLIVSPIKKLHKGIKIVTKGDLDYRVDIQTNDEIAELGEAFNQMAEELKKYHSASEESNAVLKIKVKARTKELEELAKSLEGKVKERTKELEKKLSELEKFHKLTVGRELKMIDLKKELAKLKSEKKLKN